MMANDRVKKGEGIVEIKRNFNLRKIAGEYILMPKNTSEEGYNGLISLNEMEALVWKNLEECENEEEILSLIKVSTNSIITIILLWVINNFINNSNSVLNIIINSLLAMIIYLLLAYITKSKELSYIIKEFSGKYSNKNLCKKEKNII